jgi:hypothetical protein
MKRFAPLLLIVVALAAVPVAFGDDGPPSVIPATPTATTPAPKTNGGHARMRLEILRIRLELVQLRYQIACNEPDSDRCTQFTPKVVDRLTKLDGNVQSKLDELKCTADSTDRKCTVLTKLDSKLQDVLDKLKA